MATVAIVTPIYATPENGRLDLFQHTLRSVMRQTHHDLVHIVVDDGSSVDVQMLLREHGDQRVRYFRRERLATDLKTASNALNVGIDYCIARSADAFSARESDDLAAVTFLHSDDVLVPESVEKRLHALENGFVYTNMAVFDNGQHVVHLITRNPPKGKGIEKKECFYGFPHHTVMWQSSFLSYLKDYTQRAYRHNGVFDPHLFFGEDLDMSLSSAEAAQEGSFDIKHFPMFSLLYRQHIRSITGEVLPSCADEQVAGVYDKHGLDNPARTVHINQIFDRLTADIPWSLFTYLPKKIKSRLAPVKRYFKSGESQSANSPLANSLEDMLSLILETG